MVLESLTSPLRSESRPWELLVLGFLYASIALFLALWVFEEYASLVMIFLTSIAVIPLFFNTVKYEEEKHLTVLGERDLIREHGKAFVFLMCLFIGASIAYAFWYMVLPSDVASSLYSAQTQTIISLNQKVTGSAAQADILTKIFLNNVKVMVFCIVFSFIYGTGAIFILMWNASVIGVALGNFFRTNLAQYVDVVGLAKLSSYLYVISLSVLRYAVHGIPEILAYVIGGLAGGIISAAIIRKDYSSQNFERIVLDASDLVLLAMAILFVAALLEVYVTPAIFY
ncbi:stage II sporulation protein M [Candidatus Woesearchaeota archaeon]|nr:stage II sporulation protein M [Candidatus Woesearchaeota archaeon]